MTDTEILNYLEYNMLSDLSIKTASVKLSSKDNTNDYVYTNKLYRCGDGPWRETLREAVAIHAARRPKVND